MEDLKQAVLKMIDLLPDWAKGTKLRLLANHELVFEQTPTEGLKIKIDRCNLCAECCHDIPKDYLPFGVKGDGKCKALNDDGSCGAGSRKPYACLGDPGERTIKEIGCSITYYK